MLVVTPRGMSFLGANLVEDPTSSVLFSSSRLRSPPFLSQTHEASTSRLSIQAISTACLLLAAPPLPGPKTAQPGDSLFFPLAPWPQGTPVCLSQSISNHCCSRLQMCCPLLGPTRWLISIFPGSRPCWLARPEGRALPEDPTAQFLSLTPD